MEWFATGIKASDSLERNAMLGDGGGGDINHKTRRMYPIAWWSDKHVFAYLKKHRIPLPPDYKMFGHSWGGGLHGLYLSKIREQYPEDYAKIEARFPYVGAELYRYEKYPTESELRTRSTHGTQKGRGGRPRKSKKDATSQETTERSGDPLADSGVEASGIPSPTSSS